MAERSRRLTVGTLFAESDSVLIVVDAQPGFLRELEPNVAAGIVSRIAWLVRLARQLDVPIVVTEEEPDLNGPIESSIVDALSESQSRLTKPTFGLGFSPHIVDAVTGTDRRQALLCGLETDVCVAQSAIGLHDLGWHVGVVRDAVGSPGTSHEQGLARIAAAGVALVGTKGLAYEWIRDVARTTEFPKPAPVGVIL